MTDELKDNDLLRAYLTRGSEEAFRTLVERHLDMVFGVACRQFHDRGTAEEVAQNAFTALARRAWLLVSHPNLAGWLYKAVCLEIRCRQRAESRKKEREMAAQEVEQLMQGPHSALTELIPFLDEGLGRLKETERQALILRFLENKPLRQVGEALGVSEDTAQKRVAAALESLAKYYRLRGFKTTSAAITVVILQQSTSTAPAGLACAVMKAAYIPGAGIMATGLGALFLRCVSASKFQAMAVCVCCAAVPLILQTQQMQRAQVEHERWSHEIMQKESRLSALQDELAQERTKIAAIQPKLGQYRAEIARRRGLQLNMRLSEMENLYGWSESSDFVRLPKSILSQLVLSEGVELPLIKDKTLRKQLEPVEKDGGLSTVLGEVLGVTDREQAELHNVFSKTLSEYEKLAASHFYFTNQAPPGIDVQGGESMTWVQTAFVDEGALLNQELRRSVEQILGQERAAVVFQQGQSTFANAYNGLGMQEVAETVTAENTNRVSHWKAVRLPGEEQFTVIKMTSGRLKLDMLPEPLRPIVASKLKQDDSNP